MVRYNEGVVECSAGGGGGRWCLLLVRSDGYHTWSG